MLPFYIDVVLVYCANESVMQVVVSDTMTQITWEEIIGLFKSHGPDYDVFNVSSNDQHPNNVLETQWIQRHVPQTKTCKLDDRPDMKKV
jgi:hypothetical protein